MSHRAVLRFLCLLGVFFKGLTAPIESQQTVMAAIGHNASFNCQLTQYKDVEKVMWLKIISPDVEKILVVQYKNDQDVNLDYEANMEFKDAGLMNSSMTIKNVTDQDEGCYRCVFYTYTDGAFNATICLKRSELHEPFLQVTVSNSSEEVLCSATGPPAPTVTPTVPHHNSTSVTNSTTVTTTDAPANGLDGKSGSYVWIIVGVLGGLCVVAFIVFYKCKHQNRQSPQENIPGPESVGMIPMDSENNKDTHELQNTSIEEQTTSADINMQSIKTASSQNHLEEENNLSSVPNSIHSAHDTFNEARERTTDDWKKDTNGFHQKSSKEKNFPVP